MNDLSMPMTSSVVDVGARVLGEDVDQVVAGVAAEDGITSPAAIFWRASRRKSCWRAARTMSVSVWR